MREIRLSGSEGGGDELNRLSLPLSARNHSSRSRSGLLLGSVCVLDSGKVWEPSGSLRGRRGFVAS
jgi:hypothetical protein